MPCDISMPLPSASLPPWASHLFPMPSPHKAMGPSTNDSNTCLKGSWSNNSFQSWTLMLKTCGFAVVVVLEQEGEGKKPWLWWWRDGAFFCICRWGSCQGGREQVEWIAGLLLLRVDFCGGRGVWILLAMLCYPCPILDALGYHLHFWVFPVYCGQ